MLGPHPECSCDTNAGEKKYAAIGFNGYVNHYDYHAPDWGVRSVSTNSECLVPTQRTTYLNYSTSGVLPNPIVKYVGCTNDGKISRPLVSLEVPSIPTELNSRAYYRLVCDEEQKFSNHSYTDIAHISRESSSMAMDVSGSYIAMMSAKACYRYRIIADDRNYPVRKQHFGTIDLVHEECLDCPMGLVKINGQCTCPVGMVEGPNGCQRDIKCVSHDDWKNGLCQCPGKPYSVFGADTPTEVAKLEDKTVYTRGSASLDGCTPAGNPIIKITMPDAAFINILSAKFKCSGLKSLNLANNSIYSKEISYEHSGNSSTAKFEIFLSGECYDYVAEWGIGWEEAERVPVPSIPYPLCN